VTVSRSRRAAAAIGSAIFFAMVPAVVAGLIPALLTGWRAGRPFPGVLAVRCLGVAMAGTGAVVLLAAFVRFVVEGVGTPAPVAPTERLVVGGLYRYVRNPMYVAVMAIVIGQAVMLNRPVLLVYAAAIGALMVAFVHGYEEPELLRRFGEPYQRYLHEVPPWLPHGPPLRRAGIRRWSSVLRRRRSR
jgi:protein-S-isoprenylcysteine O-methyltransferase Ste14